MPDYDKYFTTSSMIKILNKIKDKNLKLKAQYKGSIIDIELSVREDCFNNPEDVIWMITEEDVDNPSEHKCLTLDEALKKLYYLPPLLPIMIEEKGDIVEIGIGYCEAEGSPEKTIWLYSEDD